MKELEQELAAAQKAVKNVQDAAKVQHPISPVRNAGVDAELERLRKQVRSCSGIVYHSLKVAHPVRSRPPCPGFG